MSIEDRRLLFIAMQNSLTPWFEDKLELSDVVWGGNKRLRVLLGFLSFHSMSEDNLR